MSVINKELKEYIENYILPLYDKNEAGHRIEHVNNVLRRCLLFSKQFPEINLDMVYAIAMYHGVVHYLSKEKHAILCAEYFYKDEEMKKYFTDEERIVIKEAIEEHRASSEMEPKTIYGKILSSADRTVTIDDFMKRTYSYTLKYFPDYTIEQIVERAYEHLREKYGIYGYAKTYVEDIEFENFKNDINSLLEDKNKFKIRYLEINNLKK